LFRKKRGGQVAIEFIFLIAIAFGVSILFLYALIDQVGELSDEKEFVAIQDISYKIQNEFNIAAEAESGYSRDFELPPFTHMFDYNISILNTSLIINTPNKEYGLTIPQVQGQPKKGWNRICQTSGTILIETGNCVYAP